MYLTDVIDAPAPARTTAGSVRQRATLLGISSAHPPFAFTQEQSWEYFFRHMSPPVRRGKQIVDATGVKKRYMMWNPVRLPEVYRMQTGDRMAAHAEAVIEVASRSIGGALGDFDRRRIGSFVMGCSTGYVNPGPDLLLAKELGLRTDLRRTFIGHMGCYAAANVIKVAMDSVAVRPDEVVLCNNTELSSAHLRFSPMPQEDPTVALIAQALFGDASVSMLIGSAPDGVGIQFLHTHTEQLYGTHTMMSLNIGNDSFWMTLAPGVPKVLRENIGGFMEKLLKPLKISTSDVSHWVIHPGGPAIVRMLGKQLGLMPEQLRASWDVLANSGNCASATVLLVLEDILRVDKPRRGEYGVMLTFGPGLTIEGLVLRF
ncbi:putative naringenin-chalcone synthase [Mycobacterium sp. JS623]|uniref:type III polyketide synthase n=1 Tax=Mycobacterium sp. JS623 TaxID=212767 RepID=UPI0002A59EBC|nr:type III polyketide synthase [Mycobacterium sp. JS623]AGB21577.1 putative naringenin-chalcone synthase [Mycobacterium sp. JS623]